MKVSWEGLSCTRWRLNNVVTLPPSTGRPGDVGSLRVYVGYLFIRAWTILQAQAESMIGLLLWKNYIFKEEGQPTIIDYQVIANLSAQSLKIIKNVHINHGLVHNLVALSHNVLYLCSFVIKQLPLCPAPGTKQFPEIFAAACCFSTGQAESNSAMFWYPYQSFDTVVRRKEIHESWSNLKS